MGGGEPGAGVEAEAEAGCGMTDGEALLRAILENPADDTARLVYADWLEEQRFVRWAAFVRADVTFSAAAPDAQIRLTEIENLWGSWPDTDDPRTLMREHHPLLKEWVILPEHLVSRREPENMLMGVVRRGFVSEVRLPLAAFLAHAESLFRSHPVERVVLTDLRPNIDHADSAGIFDGDTYDLWFYPGSPPDRDHSVPRVLMDRLREMFPGRVIDREDGRMVFESKTWEGAYEAVLRSAVAHGRALAELPPPPAEAATWA